MCALLSMGHNQTVMSLYNNMQRAIWYDMLIDRQPNSLTLWNRGQNAGVSLLLVLTSNVSVWCTAIMICLTNICDIQSQVCPPKRYMSRQVTWWHWSALVKGLTVLMPNQSGPVTPPRRWIWLRCHQRSGCRWACLFMGGVLWFLILL